MKQVMINVPPEENDTFIALLRDGEKPSKDEPGTLLDRLGAETKAFLAHQVEVAKAKHGAVKGKLKITIDVTTGEMGDHAYATDMVPTLAKMPRRMSLAFTDETGDLTSRPADGPLVQRMHENASKSAPPNNDPKVGKVSPA